jgi:hypothetical protein
MAIWLSLAAPAAAVAQSAGDDQYVDPLAGQDAPQQQQQQPSQGSQGPAPQAQGSETLAPTQTGAGSAPSGSSGARPTLPRTGLAAGLLAGIGALLVLGGRGLGRLGRPRRTRRPRYASSSAPHLEGRYSTSDWNDLLRAMSERR